MKRDDMYYINLDRVPERCAFIEAHFQEQGMGSVSRWSATDAADKDAPLGPGYKPGTGETWALSRSEIACFESHRAIWAHAIENDLPAVVIFEDDMLLSRMAEDVIAKLLAAAAQFDVAKLDYSPAVSRFGPTTEINGISVRPLLSNAVSAGGYILSQQGCKKLLNWSTVYSDRLDDFVFMPRPGWHAVQVFPAVATQLWMTAEAKQQEANLLFSSERESDPKINQKPSKGPFLFRVKKELINGTRRLKWRTGCDKLLKQKGGFIGLVPLAPDLLD